MKGIQGLIAAVVLGIIGAAANFYYLNTEAAKKDMVPFIGIKKGAIIGRGDKLLEKDLVPVEIPKNLVGNLGDYACKWDEVEFLKGKQVWRTLESNTEGGLLLLRSDYQVPPKELELAKGDRAVGISVPRSVVTSLINPGDEVSFRVMTILPPGPTPAARPPAAPATPTTAAASDLQPKQEEPEAAGPRSPEIHGPFTVVSVGNRLGTLDVMKAAKIAPAQENVILLRISKNQPGEEERVFKLLNAIHAAGPNSYDILLHGK
jgi:hypothetical protein